MRFDERREMGAADFLFTLGEHQDVHREAAAHGEVRFQRLDVQEELALVVDGAARVEPSVAHLRLEGGRRPELEWLGGLHIVMTVDQDGRRGGARTAPLRHDDGMTAGLVHRRGQSRGAQRLCGPLRSASRVGIVLRAGAHAGNAEVVEQFALDAGVVRREVLVEVGRDGGHGRLRVRGAGRRIIMTHGSPSMQRRGRPRRSRSRDVLSDPADFRACPPSVVHSAKSFSRRGHSTPPRTRH